MSTSNKSSLLNETIKSLQVSELGKPFIPRDAGFAYIMEKGLSSLFQYLVSGDEGYASNLNRTTFGIIYAVVYTMCTQPAPNNFMKDVYDQQIIWNKTFLENIRDDIRAQHTVELRVQRFYHHWTNYQNILMKWYLSFFVFIQYSYIPFNNLPCLETQLIGQWKTIIYDEFKMEIMNYFMTEMNKDRLSETVVNTALTKYITIFTKLTDDNSNSMYSIEFEKFFLDNSTEFFNGIQGTWRSSNSNMNYCSYIYTFMNAEKERLHHYLVKSTEKALMDLIIDRFITSIHKEILMDSSDGFIYYLNHIQKDDLSIFNRIYTVMSIVPNNQGIETMSSILKDFVVETVNHNVNLIISANTKINEMNNAICTFMIEHHKLFTRLIHESFADNTIIQSVFVNSMKTVINDSSYNKDVKFNKHIALFIHSVIRIKDKEMSEENKYDLIYQAITLSTYIYDKDIFMEFNRKYLQDRILLFSPVNIEMERSIVSRYNSYFGISLSEKLAGMLQDYCRCKSESNSTSHIYTQSHWPNLLNCPSIRLPDELRTIYSTAEEMYLATFPSRKVLWHYTYGSLNMTVNYPKGKKHIFEFNILQYVVFNMFMGHNNALHYDTLLHETGINIPSFLDRVLESLLRAKLIIKNEADNTYRFNSKFSCQLTKVVIQCLPFVEVAVAPETIEIDRTHTIQACIVRLMKNRKNMSLNDIITHVLSDCVRFRPDVKFIKKNIETLIEKEYLERNSDDPTLFKYLA